MHDVLRQPSRRTVAKATAWTVPVVAVGAAAPALAASSCVPVGQCPDLSFGALSGPLGANGMTSNRYASSGTWTATTTNAGAWYNQDNLNPVGFIDNYSTKSGPQTIFQVYNEPKDTTNRLITLKQSPQPTLMASCRYTFTVGIIYWNTSTGVDLTWRLLAGSTTVASFSTSANPVTTGYTDLGIKSFVLPAGASGPLSMTFAFTQPVTHNDILLYLPKLICN